jgi:hypothetical protein
MTACYEASGLNGSGINATREAMELLKDLWDFLKERKKWWLLPMIVMLLLIGLLLFSSGSALAPFIYTLF